MIRDGAAEGHVAISHSLASRLTKKSLLALFSFTEFSRAEHRRRRPDDANGRALDQHLGHEARTSLEASFDPVEALERALQLRLV
jgi:hypothetical protein